jgi:membrane-bound lytic murein transglycosylase MltF
MAAPISIPNVLTAENDIHSGVQVLHTISGTYFYDPQIDPMNRLLFTFAAYYAGPTRIAAIRKKHPRKVWGPNKWFWNAELLVSQSFGASAIEYVSNIYKYCAAY